MPEEKKNTIELLFEDASLSELSKDFKTKASVVFENAVDSKVKEIKETLEEEYAVKVKDEKKTIEEDLEEKIDSYITYIAEEWMEKNELAVENGIQVEIAENFLKGIKNLFEESYVEVPDNKIDIVSEMSDELQKKTDMLDEEIDKNIDLKKEVIEMKKSFIVSECTKTLADTQVDKVKDLVEMVDYENEDQFTSRVTGIIEKYITTSKEKKEEKIDESLESNTSDGETINLNNDTKDAMKAYVDALAI